MQRSILSVLVCAAFVCAAPLTAAQKDGITRQQADEILAELKAIHELLQKGAPAAQAAAPPQQEQVVKTSVNIAGGETMGSKSAPITVVEFSDYQCPFCRQFHMTTFEEIRRKYVDTGKVRFVTIDFPLDFHANAERAGEATHCAAEQGQFWAMRDTLSVNASKLADADMMGYAGGLKMDTSAFKTCLDSGKYKQIVSENRKKGFAAGVQGTPSFVIGKTTAEGVDGVLFVGAQPLEAFEAKFGLFETK